METNFQNFEENCVIFNAEFDQGLEDLVRKSFDLDELGLKDQVRTSGLGFAKNPKRPENERTPAEKLIDGKITGSHSRCWQVFPQTPAYVPLFESHKHFVTWTEEQLKLGTMQNVRHLWVSVRPNGSNRPYNLNRLELRICDLIANPISLLAVMAFLEARLTQLLQDPQLDPLILSQLPSSNRSEDLLTLTQENEQAAARFSLDATLRHWYDGREILARDWIKDLYVQVYPIAKERGFSCFLSPLQKILREGNTAQQWLKQSDQGMDVKSIIKQAIITLEKEERELEHKLKDKKF